MPICKHAMSKVILVLWDNAGHGEAMINNAVTAQQKILQLPTSRHFNPIYMSENVLLLVYAPVLGISYHYKLNTSRILLKSHSKQRHI